MIDDTLAKIEERIRTSGAIQPERRDELLELVSKLKSEVEDLSGTHAEEAESIAAFTGVSTHEATRQEPNPELLKVSIQGLQTSVDGFEKSHPRLVQVVNSICSTLSNLGI